MSEDKTAPVEVESAKEATPPAKVDSSVDGSTIRAGPAASSQCTSQPSSRTGLQPESETGSDSVPDLAGEEAKQNRRTTRSSGAPSRDAIGEVASRTEAANAALDSTEIQTAPPEGEDQAEMVKEVEPMDTAGKEAEVEPRGENVTQASGGEEADALMVEKEKPETLEDYVTVVDIGMPNVECQRLQRPRRGEKCSPAKNIRVISAAAVRALGEPDLIQEGGNSDVTGQPDGDQPTCQTNGVTSDKSTSGDGGGTAQTNGGSDGAREDSADAVTVVAEKTATSPPAMYGIVTPIYKEPAVSADGEAPRPLAARAGPGLAVTGGSSVSVTTNASGTTLLSSRQSQCVICKRVKAIKYMMMVNGATSGNVICSDECLEKCVNKVKMGQMKVTPDTPAVAVPAAGSSRASVGGPTLAVANVTSLSNPAAAAAAAEPSPSPAERAAAVPVPAATPSRPVCQNGECGRPIPTTAAGRQLGTVWETLVFCSPACAVEHQKKDGSKCVFCKLDLPEMIMGKYCVRFGSDVRQFCSNLCLDGFKKRLKVCSYCQRDITRFQGSFLAPVGKAGSHQFKEFCSQFCLTRYKTTHNETAKSQPTWGKCSVCLKNTPVEHRVAVRPKESVKQLCSQICLKAYKFAIKDEGALDTCAVCKALLVVDNMAEYRVWIGSTVSHLCSQSCSNVFVLSNRSIVSCRYCKVKKYNIDMMHLTAAEKGFYCSVRCLKSCGKRVGSRRDRTTLCARCGTHVDPSSFLGSSGNSNVFCGTACAQSTMEEKAARSKAPNGVASGAAPAKLPQIQSVVSLADDDGDRAGPTDPPGATNSAAEPETPSLLPEARDHPALVMMPPAPVSRRNVCVQVQPRDTTAEKDKVVEKEAKETATISTQTDTDLSTEVPRILPVPVPMYVPTPMYMYNCPYPMPVPLVVPVPVPLLCGGEDALRLLCGLPVVHRTQQQQKEEQEQQERLQQRPDPTESPSVDRWATGKRRLSAADSGPGSERAASPPGSPDPPGTPGPPGSCGGEGSTVDDDDQPPPHKRRKVDDSDEESPSPPSPLSPSAATDEAELVDLAALLRAPATAVQSRLEPPATPPPSQETEFLGPADESLPCQQSAVKYTWCVRVLEQFVRQRNRRPPPPPPSSPDADSSQCGPDCEPPERLVADPLQATPTELAAALRAMTLELKRPGGEPYPPDLVHYILLGVQLYLLQNRRLDSLFWSAAYSDLAAALGDRLRPATAQLRQAELEPRALSLTTHVEERQLWEARVLGAHSPQSLLTTVVFFVTKHFLIGTLRWHQKLSFAMLQESITLKSRLQQSSLKLLDSRNVYKRSKTYEMPANAADPFRCPVRFIEFYLSRCPESARSSRTAPLYLTPAADGRPDGSAWFTCEPLPAAVLDRLLDRLLTVRELQSALLTDACS